MPDRPAPDPTPLDDLRAALDGEMSRLPDAYRAVIVLRDLEGRTRREAAAVLGWPEGTVAGRLDRARELLTRRMARHALAVSVAAVLSGTAAARVPELLPPTAAVTALAGEVLGTMARGKLMKAAVALLLLGCDGFGVVLQAGQKPAGPEGTPMRTAAAEATQNPPKADDVAWGEEVDGLQIGLAGVARMYRHGEKATMEVKARNVGKAEVTITYSLLRESAPQVTADVRMSVYMPPPRDQFAVPLQRVVKPGKRSPSTTRNSRWSRRTARGCSGRCGSIPHDLRPPREVPDRVRRDDPEPPEARDRYGRVRGERREACRGLHRLGQESRRPASGV